MITALCIGQLSPFGKLQAGHCWYLGLQITEQLFEAFSNP